MPTPPAPDVVAWVEAHTDRPYVEMRHLLAWALFAVEVAGDDVRQQAAVEAAWRTAPRQAQEPDWLTKAEHVLAWLAVWATPPEEEG